MEAWKVKREKDEENSWISKVYNERRMVSMEVNKKEKEL